MKIFPNYSEDIANLKRQCDANTIEILHLREELLNIRSSNCLFDLSKY